MSQALEDEDAISPAYGGVETLHAEHEAPSLLAYPATYSLIAINLAVFVAMYRFGPLPALVRAHAIGTSGSEVNRIMGWLADVMSAPFGENLLVLFGACTPDRILFGGQWWRLLTSLFVHVTLLHLLLNMWCLWNLGLFGEPLLGRPGLIAVYLLTGAAGMLQSVFLSLFSGRFDLVVAGASGAIFGIAGILIVLLSNRKLAAPWEELRSLRRQVVFFALANLLLGGLPALTSQVFPQLLRLAHLDPGVFPHIDNGAHLGGFLTGLVLGVPLFPRMTSGRSTYRTRQMLVFFGVGLLLTLLSYAVSVFARSVVG